MDATSGRDNYTIKSPSPPDVMSNAMNISSQSRTKLTNPGSHQATGRPTSQGKLSYATAGKKAVSDERLDSAASPSPGAASIPPSRTKGARPADNRPTIVPAEVSTDHQATAQRRDISELDVKHDAQSQTGQVSSLVAVTSAAVPLVILTDDSLPQPPADDADDTRNVVVQPISSSMAHDISTSEEARATRREGVSLWPRVDEFHAADH